ncbi:MAG TPA: transglycosylase domain-containing protein [Patescibacteria group bacterium]|nr:transglycosylase domain-containing protein [Patescibacteria group bacterium]
MNFLSEAFDIIVRFLVSIGDVVILIFTSPARFGKKGHSNAEKNYLRGEFRLSSGKRFKFLRSISRFIVNVILFPFRAFIFIFLLPLNIVVFLWRKIFGRRSKKDADSRRAAKIKQTGYRPSFWYKLKYIFVGFIFSALFIFIPLASFIFVSDLPSLSDLSVNYVSKTTKIYDRNGTLLYEIYANQDRTVVKLADIPKNLRNATVAIEDKDFYSHPGFDVRGMIRAFVTNVRKQGFQGGSTITQQLIKSVFLSPDQTIVRKVKEIALAFWAERRYSKDHILELYLNYVPYGGTAWGIESASNIYFGKKVQDLDLAESAFLAGLPQSPSTYSPLFGDNKLWKQRQREVLVAMGKQGYITADQEKQALSEELNFKQQQIPLKAPHFVFYVRNLLVEKYGVSEVERGGLTVRTTLDLPTEERAEQIVSSEVDADAGLNIGNGAALITDPANGDILAMVGSRNYFDQNYDGNVNLTTSLRQPGSSIKLITYTYALSQGYTEASIMDDTPLTIPGVNGGPSYTPVNYDGAFHGKIPLRTAFANSFNIPPVRLTQKFGASTIHDYGLKMGISSWSGVTDYGVSITLGAVDVKMTDLATAYGVIANGGKKVDLDPLLEVKDANGSTIYKKNPLPSPIVDPGVAYIITDILADNKARSIEFGLNTPLRIDGAKVSVKTGTTDDKRDNWTIGFTPKFLVATWVGNNDNSPMNQALASGITGAAPMWHKLTTMMLDQTGTPAAMLQPDDVVKKYCLGMDRYFIKGTETSVSCATPPPTTPSPSP